MPRPALGPRLYFDQIRGGWVVRDGARFMRTGTSSRIEAEKHLRRYCGFPDSYPLAVPKGTGFIYFLSADYPDHPVKIGFTQRLDLVRLKSLQTACPYQLSMLAAIPGTFQEEKKLHRRFAAQRLEGEWFARTDELIALIKSLNDQHRRVAA